MTKHLLSACLAGLIAAGAVAQDIVPKDAVLATLAAKNPVATSDASVKLELTFETKTDCEISQTMFTGTRLDAYVGGAKRKSFVDEKSGKTKLGAGTRISRVVEVDMKLVLGGDVSSEGAKSVTFKWPGLAGVEAEVRVVPDQSNIDLDKLDYTKTKVTLLTNYGDMRLSFRPDKAPNHVKNFIKLTKNGFYNGTKFHRIIRNFMIQGGCPNTKEGATDPPGTGDPGYKIDAEFNDINHVRGVLSAARSRDPNSAGCQFFIVHNEARHLDGQYTAYGMLDSGMEILDRIASVACGGPQGSTPNQPVHLYAAFVQPVYKQ